MSQKLVILYTDGGARGNPGPSAIGVVLRDERGKTIEELKAGIGIATNNTAEYIALIRGLELALKHKATHILCYSDSELMISQVSGTYRVKAVHLIDLYNKVKRLQSQFNEVNYKHVFRTDAGIVRADALVNECLDQNVLGTKY